MNFRCFAKRQAAILSLAFILSWAFPFCLLSSEPPRKVALLFLTRNGLPYSSFWKKILGQHKDKFNVYLYADAPVQDAFFESLRIPQLIPVSWDYHIKAWQLLLTEAFQNPENYKFVYLSESCLPIVPLERIYDVLTADETSYMRFAGPWWPRNTSREVVELPIEHRWGNHEWVILNRKHAEMIVQDREVIEIVSKYWIDSESYPSTLFSIKGCLHEFCPRPTTYVNWDLPEGGGAHPYHFRADSSFNRAMLRKAQKNHSLFARKFVPPFPAKAIWQIMAEAAD